MDNPTPPSGQQPDPAPGASGGQEPTRPLPPSYGQYPQPGPTPHGPAQHGPADPEAPHLPQSPYSPFAHPGAYPQPGAYPPPGAHPVHHTPAHRKSRARAALAGGLAGGVLAAAIAVPLTWQLVDRADQSPSSSSSANGGTTLPFGGSVPNGGTEGGTDGGSDGGTWTVPGASTEATGTPATDAQSKGVLLVETELPNGAAAGTAMVLDSSGLALTNYHVVHGSTAIRATVASTGETYTAKVIGHDEKADVALIQLDNASGLDTVKLDDDSAAVNDAVTAVGNALGQGQLLAASGKITAEDQSITTRENALDSGEALSGLIETDAPVVSGYSGGPMYDDQGEVVGISTAASSNNASGVVDQGAAESYAVPIDDALAIVDQIEAGNESGDVQIGPSPYIGISATDSTGATGVGVGTVENGGAAAKAGVAAGDSITALDGTKVSSLAELRTALAEHEPGDQVGITWTTANGSTKTATITLGDSPVN